MNDEVNKVVDQIIADPSFDEIDDSYYVDPLFNFSKSAEIENHYVMTVNGIGNIRFKEDNTTPLYFSTDDNQEQPINFHWFDPDLCSTQFETIRALKILSNHFSCNIRLLVQYLPPNRDTNTHGGLLLKKIDCAVKDLNPQISIEDWTELIMKRPEFSSEENALRQTYADYGINAGSRKMLSLLRQIDPIDRYKHVLITGETGTGKEVFAEALYKKWCSESSEHELITKNCATIPESIAESELFGISEGIASEVKARDGLFKNDSDATVFLDEIGELPLPVQSQLLRLLQFGEFEIVGKNKPSNFKGTVIAATNSDITDTDVFRKDLAPRFKRHIHIPPLRERKNDIPVLAHRFYLDQFGEEEEEGRDYHPLSPFFFQQIRSLSFPKNARELQNLVDLFVEQFRSQIFNITSDTLTQFSQQHFGQDYTEIPISDRKIFDPKNRELWNLLREWAQTNNETIDNLIFTRSANTEDMTFQDWAHRQSRKAKNVRKNTKEKFYRHLRTAILLFANDHKFDIPGMTKALLQLGYLEENEIVRFMNRVDKIFTDLIEHEKQGTQRSIYLKKPVDENTLGRLIELYST